MEKNNLIEKINSKYIIENIFDFIKIKNFILKLSYYSKALQTKLNLSLYDYKIVFYSKDTFFKDIGIMRKLDKYFISSDKYFISPDKTFNKNKTKKKLERDKELYNFDFDSLLYYLIYYFRVNH